MEHGMDERFPGIYEIRSVSVSYTHLDVYKRQILEKVKNGAMSVEEAEGFLRRKPFEEMGYAKLDMHQMCIRDRHCLICWTKHFPDGINRKWIRMKAWAGMTLKPANKKSRLN